MKTLSTVWSLSLDWDQDCQNFVMTFWLCKNNLLRLSWHVESLLTCRDFWPRLLLRLIKTFEMLFFKGSRLSWHVETSFLKCWDWESRSSHFENWDLSRLTRPIMTMRHIVTCDYSWDCQDQNWTLSRLWTSTTCQDQSSISVLGTSVNSVKTSMHSWK
jgi:hypothetical protein